MQWICALISSFCCQLIYFACSRFCRLSLWLVKVSGWSGEGNGKHWTDSTLEPGEVNWSRGCNWPQSWCWCGRTNYFCKESDKICDSRSKKTSCWERLAPTLTQLGFCNLLRPAFLLIGTKYGGDCGLQGKSTEVSQVGFKKPVVIQSKAPRAQTRQGTSNAGVKKGTYLPFAIHNICLQISINAWFYFRCHKEN